MWNEYKNKTIDGITHTKNIENKVHHTNVIKKTISFNLFVLITTSHDDTSLKLDSISIGVYRS